MTTPHATVIGAGIVGVSTAAFLQRAGLRVTLIDRLPPGQGCSFGNAGGVAFAEIVPTLRSDVIKKIPGWLMDPLGPLAIRWRHLPKALPWFLKAGRNALPDRVRAITEARASLALRVVSDFEALLNDAGALDLLKYEDALRLYDTEAQYEAEASERQVKREHGFETRRLSPQELCDLEPDLAPDFACGATHGGWYYVTNPERVVTSLARHVVERGGDILADEVLAIEHDGARAETLNLKAGGRRALDRLVICAGAYSHLLARQLGETVPLEAERGYHLTIPDAGVSLNRSLTYVAKPMAITPMEMGLRLAGTDEFAGLEAPPDWRRADALWPVAKRCLPKIRPLDATVTRWMGRRPGTPDSLPVASPSAKLGNVWYNFGHSHMGLTWGPTTGRLVAELMAVQRSNIDLKPFAVDRF